ncbi:EAL domain-containing protein [Sulfobacillus thermosulfidooxidans]|uniref:EAL domain-containing protein n=1 Tax=Sulfobacillus thermosulfidooxidans TaxID=28034 RepID=UPI0006B3FACC|nr:EAL domain-containing protein [Sulfobacillus thermosulfidooxidans]
MISFDAWTRPLFLVAQPICGAPESLAEILSRVRPAQQDWTISPLTWWRLAATVDARIVAYLDQWVWDHVQDWATSHDGHWHLNVWPQTITAQWPPLTHPPSSRVAARIAVEVTEQWPWDASTWRRLITWHDYGGAIWLDDWTDPYHIPHYPGLTGLKLDRRIWQMDVLHPEAQALWTDFIARCHDRGLQVVAEGIETPAQWDIARACGCDGFQGFLWGFPQPWPDTPAALAGG